LGPGFDLRCVKIFVDFGWEALGSREVERVSLTVENVDDKSNLVAGALRMAIGTGHAALADGDPSEREVRQLLLQIARGVGGLQHFAAAQDLLRQISAVGVPDDEAMTIESAMRQVAGYQGVKQPGIKPKRGRYYCSVGEQLHASVRERMKVIQTRCSANDDEVASICVRMAEIAQDDRIRQEVQQAAQALGVADPYAALDAMRREREEIEAELAEIAESGDAPEAEPEKKTGWMAKLRGAAGKAGRAARHGQLKIKETALRARHGSEVKALGSRIVREIAHFQYAHPEVGALTRRARRRLVTNRVLRAEQEHLKAVQTWIKR
jgi:hypothetical protein